MKLDWNRKYSTIAVYAFLVIAAGLAFGLFLKNLPPFGSFLGLFSGLLVPFVIGAVIAFVLNPILNWLEQQLFPMVLGKGLCRRARRRLGILLSFAFLLVILWLFALIVLPQIHSSIMNLLSQSSLYASEIQSFLDHLQDNYHDNPFMEPILTKISTSTEEILQQATQLIYNLIPKVANVLISVTNGAVDFVMGFIIAVYMLLSKETFAAQLKKLLSAIFSREQVKLIVSVAHDSNAIFTGFISGKLLDSFIIGILCFIGTTLLDMPYAMLVSVIVGITNVIPYFGPFIGAIPSILLILLADPMKALYFTLFILLLQQVDGNIIGPKILGDSTGLSAFWVIFAVTVFGGLMGFAGMLIGVPTFAVIYSLCRRLVEYLLRKKQLPTQTAAYASPEHPLISDKPPKAPTPRKRA